MKDVDLLKVIQYHKFYDYLLRRYGMVSVGTLEPLPGIPPTGRHIEGLISRAQGVKFILRDVYHEKRTAQFVAHGCDARSQRPFLFV
jgi:zinc/manganese transport system substrate-binding protein